MSSAPLNVGQQLGGSLGIAVLGTIAATVTGNQLANRIPTPALINQAFPGAIAVIKGRPQQAEVAGIPEAA